MFNTFCLGSVTFSREGPLIPKNPAGRLKKAQKIGEAAARILGRNHGSRYYGWSFEKGLFRYFEHPGHLAPEKALEGKYVIQTEELDLSAVQAVEAYKDLSEIERSFRELKDLVEMRPIYHRRPLLGLAEGPGK